MNKNKQNLELRSFYLKVMLKNSIYSLVAVVLSYFIFLLIFSNIDTFWGLFKTKGSLNKDERVLSVPFITSDIQYINKRSVDVEGIADAGATILLYKNGSLQDESVVGSDDTFKFLNVPVSKENGTKNIFYVVGKLTDATKSLESNRLVVEYDDIKPEIEIDINTKDQIRQTTRTYNLIGQVEEQSTVIINNKKALVNSKGEFSVYLKLDDGDNKIEVEAIDKAGNKNSMELILNFDKIGSD